MVSAMSSLPAFISAYKKAYMNSPITMTRVTTKPAKNIIFVTLLSFSPTLNFPWNLSSNMTTPPYNEIFLLIFSKTAFLLQIYGPGTGISTRLSVLESVP
jgi:hypothetical protein